MSKRFGRNQKRKMKEQLEKAQDQLTANRQAYYAIESSKQRLRNELHYLQERPILMQSHHNRPIDPKHIVTFCIDVSREKLHYMKMDDKQLFNFIANELARTVKGDESLRGLIKPYRPPTCNIATVMEL